MKYKLYVLTLKKHPIYVGVSCNVEKRIKNHKPIRQFDGYVIVKEYNDKKEALSAECGIIRYLSIFENQNNTNAKYKIYFKESEVDNV